MQVIEDLKKFSTATIFNAVVGITGGLAKESGLDLYSGPEIRCLLPDLGSTVGFAVTCELTTSDPDTCSAPWKNYYGMLDQTNGPIISVFKDISLSVGRGASFGDEMAATHKMLGVKGVVVDGTVRDLKGIQDQGLPVWASGLVPGHGLFNLKSINKSVTVAGLQINPGDLLVLDTDGVVKIPATIDPKEIVIKGNEVMAREAEYRNSMHTSDDSSKDEHVGTCSEQKHVKRNLETWLKNHDYRQNA